MQSKKSLYDQILEVCKGKPLEEVEKALQTLLEYIKKESIIKP